MNNKSTSDHMPEGHKELYVVHRVNITSLSNSILLQIHKELVEIDLKIETIDMEERKNIKLIEE